MFIVIVLFLIYVVIEDVFLDVIGFVFILIGLFDGGLGFVDGFNVVLK